MDASSLMVRVTAVVAVAAFTSCCGSSELSNDSSADSAGLDGPVLVHLDASATDGEDAEVRGVLEIEGDCLFVALDEVGERYPVVWPASTQWDSATSQVLLPNGDSVGAGDSVYGGGGYHDVDYLVGVAGRGAADLAERCVDNRYGEIAIVNNDRDGIRAGDRLPDEELSGDSLDEQRVEGGWVVERLIVEGEAVDLDAEFPVTVAIDGEAITGSAGCNEYSGIVDWSSEAGFGRFVVSELSWTEIGCEADVMRTEQGFLAALQLVDSYEAADGLYVANAGTGTTLHLVRPGTGG